MNEEDAKTLERMRQVMTVSRAQGKVILAQSELIKAMRDHSVSLAVVVEKNFACKRAFDELGVAVVAAVDASKRLGFEGLKDGGRS